MSERLYEKILNTFVQIKNEAEKNQICKRKGVGAAILEIDFKSGAISTLVAINGPSGSNKCQNIVGACGCSHAEPRVIMNYLKHLIIRGDGYDIHYHNERIKTILLSTYSPCVNCANITIDSGIIDAFAYEFLAEYWNEPPRNANVIVESILPLWTKQQIKEDYECNILKDWLNDRS